MLRRLGQLVRQRARQRVRPDRAGHGGADGAADGREQAQHGEDGGHVAVRHRRHGRHLLADHERAARERDEDLAHDHVADVVLGLPEVDHQADAQQHQRRAEVQRQPLEAARVLDGDGHDDGPEAAADAVDVVDVPRVRDRHAVHDLQVGVVVAIPEVEGDEEDGGEHAGADDGAVRQEMEGDEGAGGEESLVGGEAGQEEDAEHKHDDDGCRGPLRCLVAGQGEGEEEEHEAGADEDDTDDWPR